jgi:outer membrane protein OmpA-like peptidoglycan-associated protein
MAREPGRGKRQGVPRFISPAAADASAEQAARSWSASRSDSRIETGRHELPPHGAAAARHLVRDVGPGQALSPQVQRRADCRFGIDADEVRVHTGAGGTRVAQAMGAKAVTAGRDIFFAPGRYAPETPEGEHLLAHELAHVAQQGGEPRAVQCDIHESQPGLLGTFGIDMTAAAFGTNAGMDVQLSFDPDSAGPYSTRIGLLQIASVTDQSGQTTAAGQPLDWHNDGTGAEAARVDARTTGAGMAAPGWFVDAFYDPAVHPQSANVEPSYQEPDVLNPAPGAYGDYGWLRSPTDRRAATLTDSPNTWISDADFDFQTVARGLDSQAIYGGLEWGFRIRGGAAQSDYAVAMSTSDAAFGEALERFRGYFAHEDVVLYFETGIATPMAGEAGKLAGVPDYLGRYPDVRIELTGYADERGSDARNSALSLDRALRVRQLLIDMGVEPSRVELPIGMSETATFSPGSPAAAAGSLAANRRVIVRFVRTATSFINAP